MIVYYSKTHKRHNPPFEGYTDDGNIPALEIPERVELVLTALKKLAWAEIHSPTGFGIESILEVHTGPYLDYLSSAYDNWEGSSPVAGMAFIPGTFGIDYAMVRSGNVSEAAGFFLLDTTVAIMADTYSAAVEAANCALSGAQALIRGHVASIALCHPPGHHAGREICGGYCYLNNAAIAAKHLSHHGKVAILDIDYHAGNGTQEIFYDRSDVLMVSLHADPGREYPYYAGYAHETGVGNGEGFNHNFPLPVGIDDSGYLIVLDQALVLVDKFAPKFLVVSAGMDIYKDDPLGEFSITTQGIHDIGRRIFGMKLPSLVVMEGGYDIASLGENMVAFLSAYASKGTEVQFG